MTTTPNTSRPVFVVFSDKFNFELGDYDQICMSKEEASREVKDLRRMGHDEAYFKAASGEDAVGVWADKRRGCQRAAWPKA